MHVAAQNGNLEVVRILLKHKCDLRADANGLTPELYALRNGHSEIARLLQERRLKQGKHLVHKSLKGRLSRLNLSGNCSRHLLSCFFLEKLPIFKIGVPSHNWLLQVDMYIGGTKFNYYRIVLYLSFINFYL